MIRVHVFFNRLVVFQDGREIGRCEAAFSNQRIIIADFAVAADALKKLYAQYRQNTSQGLLSMFQAAPSVCLDVQEHLADGLSPVEIKVLHECATVATGARNIKIQYQGKHVDSGCQKPFR